MALRSFTPHYYDLLIIDINQFESDNVQGSSEFVIAVIIDVRGFSSFAMKVESVQTTAFESLLINKKYNDSLKIIHIRILSLCIVVSFYNQAIDGEADLLELNTSENDSLGFTFVKIKVLKKWID